MSVDVEELLELPEDQRWALVELLSASLTRDSDFDLTPEELAETRRRVDACLKDPERVVPAAEVLERIRSRYAS